MEIRSNHSGPKSQFWDFIFVNVFPFQLLEDIINFFFASWQADSSLLHFLLLGPSSPRPSHHTKISPLGYSEYIAFKSSIETIEIFECFCPSKYPILKVKLLSIHTRDTLKLSIETVKISCNDITFFFTLYVKFW